jgi:diguanylate cyclase (GGDEF)-like protein
VDVLTPSAQEPAADPAAGSRRSLVPLYVFVGLTFAAGVGCLGSALVVQLTHSWAGVGLQCYVLAVFLVVGELRPIPVPRGDDTTDALTVSSTFATALVLIGPLSLALLAQAVAVAMDDRLNGRPRRIVLFNIGQYVLTLTAVRAVFCALSDESLLSVTTELTAQDIPAALLAGGAYFLVNNGLVATVVALSTGLTASEVLADDVRFQMATSSILLGLAPVTAHAANFSVFMLPLLLLPMLGVHSNARMALNRQREALHDNLTGLPNREFFRRRAEKALLTSQAADQRMAIMILDLDHFKEINDTLGHHIGDEVLMEVANRLVGTAPEGVTMARLGGDEFAAVIPDVARPQDVLDLAARVAERLREPIVVDGVRMGVQASIGISLAPDHADSVPTLLKRADIALYRAKAARGDVQVYRPEIDRHTVERLSLLGDLHGAVDKNEFVLAFQPQLCTRTGDVLGVEALARWMHPRHGVIGPDVFIPLAENSGLISPFSRWGIDCAVGTLAAWRRQGHDITMSVNVSARLLSDLELPVFVAEVLARHDVPASRLVVEVTESTIMADPKRATEVLGALRTLGVKLAIDDYGTGYSSLSYLRRLAIDELKIDKSFILQMGLDDNSAIIVRSTVELAHSLGLVVTAEGVEDQPTQQTLDDLGCDRVQGFYHSRPLSREALEAWLNARRATADDRLVAELTGGSA